MLWPISSLYLLQRMKSISKRKHVFSIKVQFHGISLGAWLGDHTWKLQVHFEIMCFPFPESLAPGAVSRSHQEVPQGITISFPFPFLPFPSLPSPSLPFLPSLFFFSSFPLLSLTLSSSLILLPPSLLSLSKYLCIFIPCVLTEPSSSWNQELPHPSPTFSDSVTIALASLTTCHCDTHLPLLYFPYALAPFLPTPIKPTITTCSAVCHQLHPHSEQPLCVTSSPP